MHIYIYGWDTSKEHIDGRTSERQHNMQRWQAAFLGRNRTNKVALVPNHTFIQHVTTDCLVFAVGKACVHCSVADPSIQWRLGQARIVLLALQQTKIVIMNWITSLMQQQHKSPGRCPGSPGALEENLSRMKDWMKSICKIFLGISVSFRDESNDGN